MIALGRLGWSLRKIEAAQEFFEIAVQQSLVALIQALPAFRGECAPAGYACRIAFRTALAMRKRSHLARNRYATSADTDEFPDSDSPGALSDARRRTTVVRTLLDQIPAEQAEALAQVSTIVSLGTERENFAEGQKAFKSGRVEWKLR